MLLSTQQQLKAITDSKIDEVGLALDLSSLLKHKPKRDASCFVIPISERPAGNKRTAGPALQESFVTIGVVIVVHSRNDISGERGVDKLNEVREQVRDALFGWTPATATTCYLLGNSDLVKMETGSIWWLDRYSCKTQRKQKVIPRG